MRFVFAIAALMLALFFAAAPGEAACESGDEAASAAGVMQDDAELPVLTSGGHCQHVPCSDSSHNHMSGGCAGHSFVSAFAGEALQIAAAARRVARPDVTANGRTLLPPVPPPLA